MTIDAPRRRVLLHLSDIHFRMPYCATASDPERMLRALVLRDVRQQVETLGPVDAILTTGDIAFAGQEAEYDHARIWLLELAEATGCRPEAIFVVPGNHDVDRSVARVDATVRNALRALRTEQEGWRSRELQDQLRDGHAGPALFRPIAAYNQFAARFGCDVGPPDRLAWRHDLVLGDVAIRLHGLTSTLLSGLDGDDRQGDLYLSPLQTAFVPEDGVVDLVMCHHPPDWFMDGDDVDDAFKHRAGIHLLGHKHRIRQSREEAFLRLAAGAVNPARSEPGWEPGYNLLALELVEEGSTRSLSMDVHLRRWQPSPERFVAIRTKDDQAVFRHRLPVQGRYLGTEPAVVSEDQEEGRMADSPAPESDATEIARDLVFAFWELSSSQRRRAATELGLLSEDELRLPEPERYRRAFANARSLDRVPQLASRVTELRGS